MRYFAPNNYRISALQVEKAEYDGRDVDLDKPFRLPSGSSKKFGVYVKDGDSVKKVTFGDPNMEIKRDDPEARANFRSRHSCDTATDKTSARYWSCRMWESDATVSDITKRQTNDDIFTTEQEAIARSVDLGLGGDIHVHEDRDGQATYMPGSSHEAYLARYGSNQAGEPNMLERAIAAIIGAVSKSSDKPETKETPITKNGGLPNTETVLKVDTDQRIVWGWASVISENGEPIFDTQGDSIPPDVLTKAANEFMMDARIAKAMHAGEQVGEVIHSLPLTKELGDALGIQSAREGWVIAMKINDDATWEKVKSGEFRAFSIGGEAIRNAAK